MRIINQRHVLITGIGMLLGIVAPAGAQTAPQSQISGVVYEDKNGNGKKDRSEKGLPNIAVSNGRDVVQTDKLGNYRLPVGTDNIVFVIKPQGYRVPADENNLPRFYYRHKPAGSPALKYAGVAPTPKAPASVDFPLTAQAEPDNYQILVFGDPQPYSLEEVGYFEQGIVNEILTLKPDVRFGISLGDLVGDDLTLFEPYKKAIRKLNVPWYQVMGNHDMNYDVKHDTLSDESFEAAFGPNTYAFNYGKVHFVVLDDILYPDPRDGNGYWAGLRADQLAFLENDLKTVPRDNLVVLCYHIPLFDEPGTDSYRDADRQRLLDLLSPFPHTLSLSAHTHIQYHHFFDRKEGFTRDTPHHEYNVGTTSGDWYSGEMNQKGVPDATMRDGTPKGYMLLSFEGNRYRFDYRAAAQSPDYKIGVYTPKAIAHKHVSRTEIYANFFQGSGKDSLSFRIGDGEWTGMEKAAEPDPHMNAVRVRWDMSETPLAGRRPSTPIASPHLWKARLKANLPPGEHPLEVRAQDQYGRVFTQKTTIRVVGSQEATGNR
ncbi:MAG: calcineurin-like phosphoesterase C-terminal domain-containing protein [Cytophagales bacterium]|nr:calcineurin-like phosphoesterase C-terminal domain-containing protein [Cytophagales bacterium]